MGPDRAAFRRFRVFFYTMKAICHISYKCIVLIIYGTDYKISLNRTLYLYIMISGFYVLDDLLYITVWDSIRSAILRHRLGF